MKALITGATGFIGSHLAAELLKTGMDVSCLVRDPGSLKWLEDMDVHLRQGDCLDIGSLKEAARDAEYVFHLAGLTKARKVGDFYKINCDGTVNLARAVIESAPGVKKFVFLSSLSAAGPSCAESPLSEQCTPNPVSDYGRSKLMAEEALKEYRGQIPVLILRPPAVYGPRDKDFFLFFKYIKNGIFPYWGKCRYSLIYVDDLVRGILAAAFSPESTGQTYFIADGQVYTNDDIAQGISEAFSSKPLKLRLPKAVMPAIILASTLGGGPGILNGDKLKELKHRNWVCDPGKARRELGFSTKISLKEGIKWTADWYRIHQWL